ncbi:TRAP transporter large permease subunit [Sneathiella sp. CAU 1612]|uniref:TRAP transporter large permease protein n=1 Tax=Sneathiella sedimenti TaxID=2816034 RepID=A0ABS3F893_9PROT|nr:TRAP transporter large permease subunit [Sneathiella sedimenti]MBO0334740.1 TRAP transporter large permease subunit [Sneathiella sedimenti]
MESEIIGLIGLLVVMGLLLLRVPIAVALICVSFVGISLILGTKQAWGILSVIPYNFAAKWTLSSIPMFLLMGFMAHHGGLTKGLFAAARLWLSRLPGGLAVAAVLGCSGFAAVSGSSVACAAAMGRIAVPQMIKYNYAPTLATGAVAAGGTLGALIPPSILLILFGIFTETSINLLFIGSIGVGVFSAAAYVLMIVVRAWLNPELAPPVDDNPSWGERISILTEVWPVIVLFAVVLGGMFSGLFTATEAGAVGAFMTIVISFIKKTLTFTALKATLVETLTTTASLFFIAIGASLFIRFLTFAGTDDLIADIILQLGTDRFLLILGLIGVYIIMGMFIDPLGTMLLTIPLVMPVLDKLDIPLVWFGVFLVKMLEIGMITPPIGLNVFVLKTVVERDITLGIIFKGVMWFIAVDILVVLLMIFFPQLVLYLPSIAS